jgi:hypothetical protein
MPSRPISLWEVTTRPQGECVAEECDWKSEDASTAACKAHTRATGHSVVRTITTRTSYFIAGQK